MSGLHADWAPSSMYLTVACPGWKRLADQLPPEEPTEASLEGELAHTVAAVLAQNGGKGDFTKIQPGKGLDITEEMLEAAAYWVEALEGYPARLEQPVHVRRVHPTKNWGTPDARQWNPETRIIRVADYKYGHEFVDEFENWQMLNYAVGIADELDVFDDPGVKIEMTVVQPRYYSAPAIRTWQITTQGLKHYAERMKEAVREAESAKPRTISGPHCTHCPARGHCETFAKTTAHAVDFAGRAHLVNGTPVQVGKELELVKAFIKRLEARETGLAAIAESMIKTGNRVPGFALEQYEGRLAWTVPLEVVEYTAQRTGKTALKPPALITPTQAKQRKVLDAHVIDQYADRPRGAFKLVQSNTKTARSKFK